MAVTFHTASEQAVTCEVCGAIVDGSDHGRTLHQRWHDAADEPVIDLTDTRVGEPIQVD